MGEVLLRHRAVAGNGGQQGELFARRLGLLANDRSQVLGELPTKPTHDEPEGVRDAVESVQGFFSLASECEGLRDEGPTVVAVSRMNGSFLGNLHGVTRF